MVCITSGQGFIVQTVANDFTFTGSEKEICIMSKYDKLWSYVEVQDGRDLTLTFDEIGEVAGVPLDHSFLNYKKELLPHGWEVEKISLKQQTVRFRRTE